MNLQPVNDSIIFQFFDDSTSDRFVNKTNTGLAIAISATDQSTPLILRILQHAWVEPHSLHAWRRNSSPDNRRTHRIYPERDAFCLRAFDCHFWAQMSLWRQTSRCLALISTRRRMITGPIGCTSWRCLSSGKTR